MESVSISIAAFVLSFGAALLGLFLRTFLPDHHLSTESKDVVKLGMGLVGTMTALVLGLLVASAKNFYDTQNTEITDLSAKIVFLDRILAHYGPETQEIRGLLRVVVAGVLEKTWSSKELSKEAVRAPALANEALYDKLQDLTPKSDAQRAIQAQAMGVLSNLGQTRWLMYEQRTSAVSMPLLATLIFWLSITFLSFGLYAPANGTVVTSLFASAMSVAGAIYLIMEMYSPYSGLIQISSAPLRAALAHLGQ
ncbi:MAG TPA: hypothetical protein VL099_08890 [Candidatus Binatia bacterium]|nr:hypothetical protein [Candidatus Binatia bacterium]